MKILKLKKKKIILKRKKIIIIFRYGLDCKYRHYNACNVKLRGYGDIEESEL